MKIILKRHLFSNEWRFCLANSFVFVVIPAQAGIRLFKAGIPTFVGMNMFKVAFFTPHQQNPANKRIAQLVPHF